MEKQKEGYEYLILESKDTNLTTLLEGPDLELQINQTDRLSMLKSKDEVDFNYSYDENSKDDLIKAPFEPKIGREIVKLYSTICNGQDSIQDFCLNYESSLVDEENIIVFIQYGVINGLIERVHKYPLIDKKPKRHHNFIGQSRTKQKSFGSISPEPEIQTFDSKLKAKLDGKHSCDELCVEFNITPEQLKEKLKTFKAAVY